MSLNERKIEILKAIINDYIATAEPVGSRTIAKRYDMGISSATIRNEMSDLEEMGYIIQPHASAGRIPSDLGYRLYVDRLMKHREITVDEAKYLQSLVASNISHIDFLMEETAKMLSVLTKYTSVITEPVISKTKLKQIRLMPLDDKSVMIVAATEENLIKNYVVKANPAPDDFEIFSISNVLNNALKGYAFDEIDETVIEKLKGELGENEGIVAPVMKAIENIFALSDRTQVHLSGAKNILAFPEFSDVYKAKSIFQKLEERDVLVTLIGDRLEDDIQVFIGNENKIDEMRDCSIVTASYKAGRNSKGAIGIIGPTRMDYSQVTSVLSVMVKNIERIMKMLSEGNNDS